MHELRREFPVLERVAYLNAGTNGPVPARAVEAVRASVEAQAERGRSGKAVFERMLERVELLRTRAAATLGCQTSEVALTGSTTDGVNAVLTALPLEAGDEVLTSDQEHPGVLAPLAALRDRSGVEVRMAPFDALAGAVGERTKLIACSHVSWQTGEVVDCGALVATGVPVLLDGAQALGAISLNVHMLCCDFYAASGQKWLCGPNGMGYLYVRPERCGELSPPWPGYGTVEDPHDPLGSPFHEDARRFDVLGFPADQQTAWALAAFDVFDDHGGPGALHERATAQAETLAERLAGAGHEVAPRGHSTLVSWRAEDPPALVAAMAEHGIVLRDLPGTSFVRASVGAWNDESDLERLIAALAA
ncbi:MAG: aminotransferase class V-fold PLP-dependent enzyme [Thermoleophilaceae bacterium]|nr:aminotransferase class V-fold PLP-dependent enzyme [Thermoleophilaceae bacterium]